MTVKNLEFARDYARRGWDMAPMTVEVRPGSNKKDVMGHAMWATEGTHDLDTIERWFGEEGQSAHPYQGIGVITGKRSNLFVVDVDNEYFWEELLDNDPSKTVPKTYTVRSRSGGKHLYFKWPDGFEGHLSGHLFPPSLDLWSEKDRLAGIDVREEGGLIFAPPTVVRNPVIGTIDGEYTVVDPAVELADVPEWILEQYRKNSATSRKGSRLKASGERPRYDEKEWPDKADWNKPQHQEQLDKMLAWAKDEFQSLKDDPGSLWDDGVTRIMGVLVRLSNSPWFKFSDADLDKFLHDFSPQDEGFTMKRIQRIKNSIIRRADGEAFRPDEDEEWMKEIAAILAADAKESERQSRMVNGLLENIPEEFWKARPLFGQIRDAAHKRRISADTVFHSFLAGICSKVPHQYQIKTGLASDTVHFTHFVAIVGPSGSGKGTGAKRGFELANAEVSGTPSTGEGLIEYFLGDETDWDNPGNYEKDGVTPLANPLFTKKVQVANNGLFSFGEGSQISQLASRTGSTLYPTLLMMAVGEELSNLNATAALKRKVEEGSYAIGLVGQFQIKVSGQLLDQDESGLPQRFSWASTNDPNVRRNVLVDPVIHIPHIYSPGLNPAPIDIPISENIFKELDERAVGAVAGDMPVPHMENHRPIKMLQVAGLLRLLDGPNMPNGRYKITDEDWYLAGLLHETSRRVREQLLAKVAAGRAEDFQKQGMMEGEKLLARQDFMETKKHVVVRDQILEKIDKLHKEGKHPAKIGYIKQMISTQRKPLVEPVLNAFVDEGILTVSDDGVYSRAEATK